MLFDLIYGSSASCFLLFSKENKPKGVGMEKLITSRISMMGKELTACYIIVF